MKLLLQLSGGLVILVLVVAIGIWFYMDVIIKSAVERVGPEVTGTPVTLDSARLSVFSGSGSLNGFVVGNPPGFEYPNAFSLGSIDLQVDTSTLQDDVIVIKSINIVAPEITYESGSAGDNLQTLMRNIQEKTSGGGAAEESSGEAKKIIIEHFSLTDGNVTISHSMLDEVLDVPMPDLTLTGIGRNTNGATIAEASKQIFQQISSTATKAVGQSALLDQAKQQVEDRLKEELGGSEKLDEAKDKAKSLLEGFGL